jgi:polysaccharide deacetylase 2 family uncharacterized protein YibQ
MSWNNDDFADLLHRACCPDPTDVPSARPRPIPKLAPTPVLLPARRDLARVPAFRELVASAKSGYGLAALLILGAATWLTLPYQVAPAGASLAAPAPSQVAGQITSPALPDAAEPTADERSAVTAPGPALAAKPRPVQAAETKPFDPGIRRLSVPERTREHQPPPAPSVEPAAQTVQSELALPPTTAAAPAQSEPPIAQTVQPEIALPSGPAPSVASPTPRVNKATPRSSGTVAEAKIIAKSDATAPKPVIVDEARMQIMRFLDTVVPLPAAEPKLAPPAESLPAAETELAALAPPPPASHDQPVWLRFAVPAPPADGRPRIAVVIDDLGLDKKRTERTILLPGPVTLSFLAYATDLPKLGEAARHAGHELLVSVPMEPMSHVEDMGPNGLMVGLAHDELLRRLGWNLDRFTGYVGINNHMGSRFTHDAASMAPVMEELRTRGLLFLDARTVGNSTGVDVARKIGVPHAGRDVFLDNDASPGAIAAQLAEVERVARQHGSAIAIGHARDATIEQLDAWLASLPGKGLTLVPVSTIVRERLLALH